MTRGRWIAAGLVVAAGLAWGALAAALAAGPVDAPWLKPAVRAVLVAQVHGGRAQIGRVRLVWSRQAHSLGVELSDADLVDGRGRLVMRARRAEAGLSLDGLGGWTVAPARITASDFFVAMSVSRQGRYALGYDATGTPAHGKSDADLVLRDLTGAARQGRPTSFLRQILLRNGDIRFRQVGGSAAWTGRVREVELSKLSGRLKVFADARLEAPGSAPATLFSQGQAAEGLKNARLTAVVNGLVPARVFPSVGGSEPLSRLDAVVNARGSIAYDLRSGIRAADLWLGAGRGLLRVGDSREPFTAAEALARYEPATGAIELTSLKVAAARTTLDLSGSFRLRPEDPGRHIPARLDVTVGGPRLLASLAADAPPQELTNVSVVARFTPERRTLELVHAGGLLAGSPVEASGQFTRDRKDRLGVRLNARVGGVVTPEQVFAFWPRSLVGSVRDYLHHAIQFGRLSSSAFAIDAPPGSFDEPTLENRALRISFNFTDAAVRYADQLAPITQGAGSGVVQGNRFDLTLHSGRMENVALSEGSIEIPSFKSEKSIGRFRARAQGDVREIMSMLDRAPLNLFTKNGFSPTRVSGPADLRFELLRPMLLDVPADRYKVAFAGFVHRATLTQAALGWDLTGAEMKIQGDEQKVAITGTGTVGPYRGPVSFDTRYQGRGDRGMNVAVNGVIDAAILGGRSGASAPFAGKFRAEHGNGAGIIHSSVFDGRLTWKDGNGADRVVLTGWTLSPALRRIGAPFVTGAPDRFATELRLARNGDLWRGALRADALSGLVSYSVAGQRSRLVYQAEIGAVQARRIGLSKLPLFEQSRPVLVDASWTGPQGTAQVRIGPVTFALSWDQAAAGGAQKRMRVDLTAAEVTLLGLPSAAVRPGETLPVNATWQERPEGAVGQADVDGVPVRFQTASGRNGAADYVVRAELDRHQLRRWGLPDLVDIDGVAGLTARWSSIQNRASAGRLDMDLTRTTLSVAQSDWKKPGGQAAHMIVDFLDDGQGSLRLTRISGASAGAEIEGSALLGPRGRLVSLDLTRARLNGLIDATVRASRDGSGLSLNVRGAWLDARRLLAEAARTEAAGAAGGSGAKGAGVGPIRIDAQLDGLRFSDEAVLRDVRATGVWGPDAGSRRLDVAAVGVGGGRMTGKLYPQGSGTAVQAQAANAGDAVRTLFGVASLRGGTATVSGRLVEGGADLEVQMANVRLVKAPAMAQILTMASLRGLADTLNGDGVMFSTVDAPLQIRGRKLIIGQARATGSALGLTTKGVASLDTGVMDFQGTIAPAYTLNAAMGHVPVLGQILTSRKGEGIVGLGYWAKGSFDKPQVSVNPLSVLTPGILRRMFETASPGAEPAAKRLRPARPAAQ